MGSSLGSGSGELRALLTALGATHRDQAARLVTLRDLAREPAQTAGEGVPARTLDALLSCLDDAARSHAETSGLLAAHVAAALREGAGRSPGPLPLARLLRRLHVQHESILGFLDYATRTSAHFVPPEGASDAARSLYGGFAEWDRRERALLRLEAEALVPQVLAVHPALGNGASPVSLAIHRREVVSADGRRAERTVFCPAERRSMDTAFCRTCPLLRHIGPDEVVCTPHPQEPAALAEPALRLGEDACVGEAMGSCSVSVSSEILASEVARLFGAPPTAVLVVDDEDHLVGILDLTAQSLAPEGAASGAVGREGPSIPESAPLADAVACMVRTRLRRLPVVGADGRVVGLLTDLDALRWVGRHRAGR